MTSFTHAFLCLVDAVDKEEFSDPKAAVPESADEMNDELADEGDEDVDDSFPDEDEELNDEGAIEEAQNNEEKG